ncbi:unnamed protein product, partial [Rotaria magnacalcarata]
LQHFSLTQTVLGCSNEIILASFCGKPLLAN